MKARVHPLQNTTPCGSSMWSRPSSSAMSRGWNWKSDAIPISGLGRVTTKHSTPGFSGFVVKPCRQISCPIWRTISLVWAGFQIQTEQWTRETVAERMTTSLCRCHCNDVQAIIGPSAEVRFQPHLSSHTAPPMANGKCHGRKNTAPSLLRSFATAYCLGKH